MKVVVITGSTRGLGYGLAQAFLALDCNVALCGRSADTVAEAAARLAQDYPHERILSMPCDVTRPDQLQALWDAAQSRFGRVDIWINNAGLANQPGQFWNLPEADIHRVIDTNLKGVMFGSQVAARGMLSQGFGAIYNMEGLGSRGGMRVPGLALYASTKAGLRHFNRSLADEVQGTPVVVGSLSPGMVVTDMLTRPYADRPQDWERVKRIFNILADRVETVAPWMARRILENTQSGASIRWATPAKIMARFLLAPFRKRDLFDRH